MMYRGSEYFEKIYLCPEGRPTNIHYIELVRCKNMLVVETCCTPGWSYSFISDDTSDFERIRFNIMDQIFKCKGLDELLNRLGIIFEDGFADILIEDDYEDDNE